MLKKKIPSQKHQKPNLSVIIGDIDTESYGLGDPCVPPDLRNFPENKPKSRATLSKAEDFDVQH
tara:strand:+ start:51 stop:242 length:192 start_codon:yes stop_codon:yes gene_type:complete